MYIIAGLGNPGRKYENTRHNMGFIAVDLLAEKYGIKVDKIKFKALVGEGRIAGQKVLLVKPQTYMNLSGESIREVMSFYKEDIENLIVIYDDIDIPTGTIRLRKKGRRRHRHSYGHYTPEKEGECRHSQRHEEHRVPSGGRRFSPHKSGHRKR